MNFYRLTGLFAATSLGIVACSSPANLAPRETATAVSGKVTLGNVPAGAHVAIVFAKGTGGGFVVTNDTPLNNGEFSFDLTNAPADDLFVTLAFGNAGNTPGSSSTGVPATPTPPANGGVAPHGTVGRPVGASRAPLGSPAVNPENMHVLAQVSGTVTAPFSVAEAGFIVYLDANGNGQLDITGTDGETPDTILGGNSSQVLAYFRGGHPSDYASVSAPWGQVASQGYNLATLDGRLLPLTAVDLTLDPTAELPRGVCTVAEARGPDATSPVVVAPPQPNGTATKSSYPSPTDPGLSCAADGKSFTYTPACPTQPVPVTPPVTTRGVCPLTSVFGNACPTAYGEVLGQAGDGSFTVPVGWPCAVISAAPPSAPIHVAIPPSLDPGAPVVRAPFDGSAGSAALR